MLKGTAHLIKSYPRFSHSTRVKVNNPIRTRIKLASTIALIVNISSHLISLYLLTRKMNFQHELGSDEGWIAWVKVRVFEIGGRGVDG